MGCWITLGGTRLGIQMTARGARAKQSNHVRICMRPRQLKVRGHGADRTHTQCSAFLHFVWLGIFAIVRKDTAMAEEGMPSNVCTR